MVLKRVQLRPVLTILARFGLALYAIILVFICVSHASLADPNWPFGLFASFTRTVLAVLPISFVLAFAVWRRLAWILPVLGALVSYPVLTYDDFAIPSHEACGAECITVVMSNLRHRTEAVVSLGQQLEGDFNVLILTEVPNVVEADFLADAFNGRVDYLAPPDHRVGSRLAVISRDISRQIDTTTLSIQQSNLTTRDIVIVSGTGFGNLSVIGVHPIWPKTAPRMRARDVYLKTAGTIAETGGEFILIGDYNLTPWEPVFRTLPGSRAGDPRFLRTWNANDPTQNLVIDHARISSGLRLIESSVLDDIESDHYPIRIRVIAKE